MCLILIVSTYKLNQDQNKEYPELKSTANIFEAKIMQWSDILEIWNFKWNFWHINHNEIKQFQCKICDPTFATVFCDLQLYFVQKKINAELLKDAYQVQSTPGPRLMRIHLVQNSTSARSGNVPQIFT
jgi:hypothetical protein